MKRLLIAAELSLPIDVVTEAIGMLGRRGGGKTYAAQLLAELMHAAGAQFVALDPVGNWWALRLDADGKTPSPIQIPVFGGLRGDVPLEPTAGRLIADVIVDRGISAVVDISQFESEAEKGRFAYDFGARLFYRKKAEPSAIHLFLEEAQEIVPQNPAKDGNEAKVLHVFQRIAKLGRNYGIGFSVLSQRPQEVHKKVLNLVEVLFAFQLSGKHERRAVVDWIEEKGIDEDIDAILPKLKRGAPHVWSPVLLGISRVVSIGQKQSFDASQTPKVGKRTELRELAPIDLEQLGKEIAASRDKADANDPKKLAAKLQRYEKELTIASAEIDRLKRGGGPEATASAREQTKQIARLRKIVESAMKFIINVSTQNFDVAGVDKAELERAVVAAVERATQIVDARLAQRTRGMESLRDEATRLIKTLKEALGDDSVVVAVDVKKNEPYTIATPRNTPNRVAGREVDRTWVDEATNPAGLGKGEHAMLRAIAMYYPNGVDAEQLSVLTGYKRSSRNTYLQRLQAAGLVERFQSGQIEATAKGMESLGFGFEPLPTGAALRDYWMGRLPEGEKNILAVLVKAYPRSVARDEIDIGYQRSSRNTYLQRLGARKLVDSLKGGMVKASSLLFDPHEQ